MHQAQPQCFYCNQFVRKLKHKCLECGQYVCDTHRRTKGGVINDKTYHCSPKQICPQYNLYGISRAPVGSSGGGGGVSPQERSMTPPTAAYAGTVYPTPVQQQQPWYYPAQPVTSYPTSATTTSSNHTSETNQRMDYTRPPPPPAGGGNRYVSDSSPNQQQQTPSPLYSPGTIPPPGTGYTTTSPPDTSGAGAGSGGGNRANTNSSFGMGGRRDSGHSSNNGQQSPDYAPATYTYPPPSSNRVGSNSYSNIGGQAPSYDDRTTINPSTTSSTTSSATTAYQPKYIPFPTPPEKDSLTDERIVELKTGETLVANANSHFLKASFGFIDGSYIELHSTRGVVLGATDKCIVWHIRGEKAPLTFPLEMVKDAVVLKQGRCRHCGHLIAMDESALHMSIHKRDGAATLLDERYGTCCGNINILTSLNRVRLLGSGAQGEVWLCSSPVEDRSDSSTGGGSPGEGLNKPSGKQNSASGAFQYVLKIIKCETAELAASRYQQSVRIMNIRHPHLITYIAVQLAADKSFVGVVMPFYDERDLATFIREGPSRFNETYILSLGLQVGGALTFLHSHEPAVIHGDIKPANVLMCSKREQVVLMDLDTSSELLSNNRIAVVKEGTTEWMSPEAFQRNVATPKSDIWSLGLLIFVLAVLPDFPMMDGELMNSNRWSQSPQEYNSRVHQAIVNRNYSGDFATLVMNMMDHDALRRPSATQLTAKITDIMEKLLIGSC